MDQKNFVPPLTKRIKNSLVDPELMIAAVNSYFSCDFKSMRGFIMEYGEDHFFYDLNLFFTNGYWQNPANKYASFVGIVISFFRIEDINFNSGMMTIAEYVKEESAKQT
jgi:hypothetical protein